MFSDPRPSVQVSALRPSTVAVGHLDTCDSSKGPSLPKSWYAGASRTQMPFGDGGGRSQFWLVSSIRDLNLRGGPPLAGSNEDPCLEMVT